MAALAMGLAEAKNSFSRVKAEGNRGGRPATALKDNKSWAVIQPARSCDSATDIALDLMDEYADVFEELAK